MIILLAVVSALSSSAYAMAYTTNAVVSFRDLNYGSAAYTDVWGEGTISSQIPSGGIAIWTHIAVYGSGFNPDFFEMGIIHHKNNPGQWIYEFYYSYGNNYQTGTKSIWWICCADTNAHSYEIQFFGNFQLQAYIDGKAVFWPFPSQFNNAFNSAYHIRLQLESDGTIVTGTVGTVVSSWYDLFYYNANTGQAYPWNANFEALTPIFCNVFGVSSSTYNYQTKISLPFC